MVNPRLDIWLWLPLILALVAVGALLVFGASVALGNQFGWCGEYWGDGTNNWEDCIEFGEDAVDKTR